MSSDQHTPKQIAILGSTGSIGTQTLDIIAAHPDRFRATMLSAYSNWRLLAQQALTFQPDTVVIADATYYEPLREALAHTHIRVMAGAEALAEAVAVPEVDMVVTATVGYSGMLPTISAIEAGKTIALANKETLVVAGELIDTLVRRHGVALLPVDSEHSAIFQCLQGEPRQRLERIILTASGGPFRIWPAERLAEVTAADALKHPNWDMGAKVTIDSASMMNKGFEMIEACWLFGCRPDDIDIVVHPQSIVHSMVQFADGGVKAQLGLPDMHLPISYALSYPDRLPGAEKPMCLTDYSTLTFEHPDMKKFPLLAFAFEAMREGGIMPCTLNAANERAVAAFLAGRIRFTDMPLVARHVMDHTPAVSMPGLSDFIEANTDAVDRADAFITTLSR